MDLEARLEKLEQMTSAHSKEIEELRAMYKKTYTRTLVQPGQPDDEFGSLKSLLESNMWPPAVESFLICTDSEQDKIDRAEGILNLILDIHLENLNFLDFGCGEGHVINLSLSQNPKLSVGYDIKEHSQWKQWPQDQLTMFTTTWDEVKKNAPYNIILLYDVIDHLVGEKDITETLGNIKTIMAPNARVYVRCHPWSSRHATHLYHKINKAYVHLVFSEDELTALGYDGWLPTAQVIHPLLAYKKYFNAANFRTQGKEQVIKSTVEPFFQTTPVIAHRIKKNYLQSHDAELRNGKKFPFQQLEVQFIDYILV